MEQEQTTQATPATEQLDAALATWTEEERAWLATVPEALKNVAKNRGKFLFCLTLQVGIGQTAVNILASIRGRENRRFVLPHLQRLVPVLDDLTKVALASKGLTVQDMLDCRRELEVAHSLANGGKQVQPGERVSKGGIILDS